MCHGEVKGSTPLRHSLHVDGKGAKNLGLHVVADVGKHVDLTCAGDL